MKQLKQLILALLIATGLGGAMILSVTVSAQSEQH